MGDGVWFSAATILIIAMAGGGGGGGGGRAASNVSLREAPVVGVTLPSRISDELLASCSLDARTPLEVAASDVAVAAGRVAAAVELVAR